MAEDIEVPEYSKSPFGRYTAPAHAVVVGVQREEPAADALVFMRRNRKNSNAFQECDQTGKRLAMPSMMEKNVSKEKKFKPKSLSLSTKSSK